MPQMSPLFWCGLIIFFFFSAFFLFLFLNISFVFSGSSVLLYNMNRWVW